MREKIVCTLAALAGLVLAWNLYNIFVVLPDEKLQGGIYRILFFHLPSAITGGLAAFIAMGASVLYLIRKDLRYDSLALSVTEVGLTFGILTTVTGMIWARIIWGIWWTWDARLTSMLVSMLLYAGYLMLRDAVDDPSQRARYAAVLSIFSFPAVIITWKSIEWWRTQHPGPVFEFRGGGGFDPDMLTALGWNFLAIVMFGIVLAAVRMRQAEVQREMEGLRREAMAR